MLPPKFTISSRKQPQTVTIQPSLITEKPPDTLRFPYQCQLTGSLPILSSLLHTHQQLSGDEKNSTRLLIAIGIIDML